LQALAFVQEKYAGQAKAGTTLQQRFSATLVDTEEIIGKALLPTVNKITKEFGDWLAKMNESGRLQKDVADTVHLVSDAFKVLGAVIGTVDKVTGSFKNTFEALLALFAVKKIFTFGNALIGLAAKWGIVTTAASEAAAAETVAAGAGAAGGAGVAVGAAAGAGIAAAPIIGEAAALGFIAFKGLTSGTGPSRRTTGISGSQQRVIVAGVGPMLKKNGVWYRVGRGVLAQASPDEAAAAEAALTGRPFGPRFRNPATGADSPNRGGLAAPPVISTAGPRGAPTIFKSFTDTAANALAQARAALTKGTQDDVAAAKAEIAQIKKEIASGHLKGAALIHALQAEAGAINTIQSAQAAAIQATTARIQNLIDPLKLEVELSRAQATGASPIPALKKLLAAARKELAKGLSLALQKQALDQITSLKQQIKQAQTQPAVTFTESAKLQLALAKDQALGRDPTKDLQKLRKAILRFIAAHKKNTAALTDAYNQLYAVNQQLGSTIASALGGFKQASTRALTKGLGLTPAQRRALRARLSQLGPGGTIPGSGIGAAGFIIGTDGRPLVVHTHINIDGKRVADNTTRHQQRHRRRNPRQRRGHNAGGG
jgi:hypothetical protein